MSLGKHTECDLSAGLAKIDLEILTKQVEIHFYSMVREINQQTNGILNLSLNKEDRCLKVSQISSTGSDELIMLSKNMAETAELLHTLYETSGREIEVVIPGE